MTRWVYWIIVFLMAMTTFVGPLIYAVLSEPSCG